MGVKDLMSILKKKCPEQLIEVDMRELVDFLTFLSEVKKSLKNG